MEYEYETAKGGNTLASVAFLHDFSLPYFDGYDKVSIHVKFLNSVVSNIHNNLQFVLIYCYSSSMIELTIATVSWSPFL
jgi:hypothetical protein